MLAANALHPRTEHTVPQDIRWMNLGSAVLAGLGLDMVLVWGVISVARLPWFDVQHIVIDGDLNRHNLLTVRANTVSRLQGGYFSIDLADTREVFESLPWVRRAVVRRVWPNEVRVHLEEHQAAAYWHHDGREEELVNSFGEVFEANLGDVEDEGLPVLRGPTEATPEQAAEMLAMLHQLQPVLAPLGEVHSLRLNERGGWTVWMDNEARIELGRGRSEDVLLRTERFVRSYPALAQTYGAPLVYADLRYAQGYAIKLQGLSTFNPQLSSTR